MTVREDDIVSMLREGTTPGTYGHALREAAADEIERLRALLECALSEHDNREGKFAAGYMTAHWSHGARTALATHEQKAGKDADH